jgi:hypothetical protein
MFSTLDSQPQEWLLNNPDQLHTLCFCCFKDSASARHWIHTIVPKNKNGTLLKWSTRDAQRRRLQFAEQVEKHYDELDFVVHCISSTEHQISLFANVMYWQNFHNIRQEPDKRGRNCLVFKITEDKIVSMPALRAAKLIWIYFCIKYMKEVHNLSGFIYSDWFACDSMDGEHKALGVAMVNFLLRSTGFDLQLSIAERPSESEADFLSDWFAGWSNSSKNGTGTKALVTRFDALTDRTPHKIDWIMFAPQVTMIDPSAAH